MPTKQYDPFWNLSELQDEKYFWCAYLQDSDKMADYLKSIMFPAEWVDDITGMIVLLVNGSIEAMWLSESGHSYTLDSIYHPLPYYLPEGANADLLSLCWQDTNEEYCKEK